MVSGFASPAKIIDHHTQAWGTIPLDMNETIDMRVITDTNDKIQDFTMHYRYSLPDSNVLLVRADYGHGKAYPHMDVEILSQDLKLSSIEVVQNDEFPFL